MAFTKSLCDLHNPMLSIKYNRRQDSDGTAGLTDCEKSFTFDLRVSLISFFLPFSLSLPFRDTFALQPRPMSEKRTVRKRGWRKTVECVRTSKQNHRARSKMKGQTLHQVHSEGGHARSSIAFSDVETQKLGDRPDPTHRHPWTMDYGSPFGKTERLDSPINPSFNSVLQVKSTQQAHRGRRRKEKGLRHPGWI